MWLKQLLAVAWNGGKTTVGDPFFLVLHLTLLVVLALLGALPAFTFGDHLRFLRDQTLALVFMAGCLAVLFGFVRVVTGDLRRGAGAILRSRPLDPVCLLAGKLLGVTGATVMLTVSAMAAFWWMTAVSADGMALNLVVLGAYLGVIVAALAAGALRHYLVGGAFCFATNGILAAGLVVFGVLGGVALGVEPDWVGLKCWVLIALALVVFAAVMLPVAVCLDGGMVLSAGLVVFFGGLLVEHVARAVEWRPLGQLFRAVLPNWQIFWLADRLGEGKTVSLGYYGVCAVHVAALAAVYVVIASLLYERLEVGR